MCDPIKVIAATLSTANKESAYIPDTPRFLLTTARVTAEAPL